MKGKLCLVRLDGFCVCKEYDIIDRIVCRYTGDVVVWQTQHSRTSVSLRYMMSTGGILQIMFHTDHPSGQGLQSCSPQLSISKGSSHVPHRSSISKGSSHVHTDHPSVRAPVMFHTDHPSVRAPVMFHTDHPSVRAPVMFHTDHPSVRLQSCSTPIIHQ